jgi:hypothetical protein
MENHRCPHCQTSIRGLTVFKVALPRRSGPSAPAGGIICPGCDRPLIALPNRWQLWGFGVAILTIVPRLFVSRAEFPVLWMALSIGTIAAFVAAIVGIFWFPRYRATD